ncbi:O-acetyl-ADP-ribose deacetylase (regulator of RNase III), contains Macro domain [Sarcina sp. DSM 11001]|uniref:macro domain-containing protein n=1 Tax=Sarcina sp. DSM 11001 TaxID=1798184 RepID=UPI000888D2D4|nr:macro domain-containing protein [Sarcina sp. DSM 11001]SDL37472.1 O-acetyl-ADP-ribose deacetylase (regulator of RNase III), contains Macro domain [Sarcina sp. DSM 11001]
MAFNYYTIASITNINIDDIPDSFITYYQNLTEELQAEIRDVRPDLVQAIEKANGEDPAVDSDEPVDDIRPFSESGDAVTEEGSLNSEDIIVGKEGQDEVEENQRTAAEDAFQNEETPINEEDDDTSDDEVDPEDEAEYSPVLEAWEDISIRAWQQKEIETSVVVCKIIPDKTKRCPIHRIELLEKQLKIKKSTGGTYGIKGMLCPECMDFFIERDGVDDLIRKLDEYSIPTWIQTLEDTLAEWKENTTPQPFQNDTPIYVPDTWVDGQTTCPIHPDQTLVEDTYQETYRDRSVVFQAHYCKECHKLIMRNSLAQKLEMDCSEIGLPPIEFRPLRPAAKPKVSAANLDIHPDYIIANGVRDVFDFGDDEAKELWTQTFEPDTFVVNYTRSCIEEDHEAEDTLALIKVQEKKEGIKYYVVLVGYCEECEKYYIAKEDFALLAENGRPVLTLIDETGTYNYITSGKTFDRERDHLNELEGTLDKKIDDIQHSPGYVAKYAVGDYDDGSLIYAKYQCEPLYKEIDRLSGFKPRPYEYRTDLTFNDQTEIFYLGIEDIELDGNKHVISYNSDLGRKMVNYRTLDLIMGGVQRKVKRRRSFDIDKEILYRFTEQSDDDVIFKSGITDAFLINVLNQRKKQHQLIDIISTIQDNQNAIVDVPIRENLIVQGCAGSGKTMVLLRRLSTLKYNNPDFNDYNVVILTPNGNFNTHIAGLASSLQLGYIDRYSVEDYYYNLIQKYDISFKLKNPISDEMNVNQTYVDYMYSDEFRLLMEEAYQQRIAGIREMFGLVKEASRILGREAADENKLEDNALVGWLRLELATISGLCKAPDEEYAKCVKEHEYYLGKQKNAQELLESAESGLKEIINAETARVSKILSDLVSGKKEKINSLEKAVSEKEKEYKKINDTVLVYRKGLKLSQLQKEIDQLKDEEAGLLVDIENLNSLLRTKVFAMDFDDLMRFFDSAATYSSDVLGSKAAIRKQQERLDLYKEEADQYPEKLQELQEKIKAAAGARVYQDLLERVKALSEKADELSPKRIYQDIYDIASARADDILFARTGRRYIQNVRGTHRYDLYLQLIFAMEFFKRKTGENRLISIDEGQDLTPGEYRLIKEINEGNPIFNIYGDTNQLLKYGRGITDWSLIGKTIESAKHFALNENYRNTNQITQFCNETFKMSVSLTGVDGHSVKEIARVKLESVLANIKATDERIAVILPRTVKKKEYIDKDQIPPVIQEILGDTIANGTIAVVYVDEVKGVEFDRVFVVPNSMTDNERYIAFTRALSELTVVYDESLDPVIAVSEPEPQKKDEKQATPEKAHAAALASSNITIGKVKIKRDKKAEERREALRQRFRIGASDITEFKGGAIVTPYSSYSYSGVLQTAICKAAGKEYVDEIKIIPTLGACKTCLTKGYKLPAKYVIHVNSPKWNPENEKESEELLAEAYRNVMQCAMQNGIRTIAIPSLSTGFKRFPAGKAAYIALYTVGDFVNNHLEQIDKVEFSILNKNILEKYESLFRAFGRKEEYRISIENCKKCGRIRKIRKRTYDKYIVDGYIPSYCNTCGEEVSRQSKCIKCGELFGITLREQDYSEQTGTPSPNTCPECIKKEKEAEKLLASEDTKNEALTAQSNEEVEKAVPTVAHVSSTTTDFIQSSDGQTNQAGSVSEQTASATGQDKTEQYEQLNTADSIQDIHTEEKDSGEEKQGTLEKAASDTAAASETTIIQGKKTEAANVVSSDEIIDVTESQDEETLNASEEDKRYLNYVKIQAFLSTEILDQEVKDVNDEIRTVLALSHVKSNKELIRFLMDEDVFDDKQLSEIEEYMKKLILSMFYV